MTLPLMNVEAKPAHKVIRSAKCCLGLLALEDIIRILCVIGRFEVSVVRSVIQVKNYQNINEC